ncbi:MAG TPA: carbohydrate ABC transporter permease, partial [bacterium]|nr:carbohydrate ABC transporter permease [bacterium]
MADARGMTPPSSRPAPRRRQLTHLSIHVALLIAAGLVLLPYYLMVVTSLKPVREVFTDPFTWIPSRLALENYVD